MRKPARRPDPASDSPVPGSTRPLQLQYSGGETGRGSVYGAGSARLRAAAGAFRPHESVTRIRPLHGRLQDLVMQRTRFVQWMQSLDQMNVRVHRAVSDLSGQTVMRILRVIVKGEHNPEQ